MCSEEIGCKPLRRTAAAALHCACVGRGAEVLLMDEPASALDPISTGKIEELISS